jgi:hypothetical protein
MLKGTVGIAWLQFPVGAVGNLDVHFAHQTGGVEVRLAVDRQLSLRLDRHSDPDPLLGCGPHDQIGRFYIGDISDRVSGLFDRRAGLQCADVTEVNIVSFPTAQVPFGYVERERQKHDEHHSDEDSEFDVVAHDLLD